MRRSIFPLTPQTQTDAPATRYAQTHAHTPAQKKHTFPNSRGHTDTLASLDTHTHTHAHAHAQTHARRRKRKRTHAYAHAWGRGCKRESPRANMDTLRRVAQVFTRVTTRKRTRAHACVLARLARTHTRPSARAPARSGRRTHARTRARTHAPPLTRLRVGAGKASRTGTCAHAQEEQRSQP